MRENARWLAAGGVLTFASSFGQTFFIALSGPALRAELDLSHGEWGGVYTLGTVASAALLTSTGFLADRFRIRALAACVFVGLAAACVGMAFVGGAVALGFLIFCLRFLGQGYCSHLAFTAMGRWFSAQRGRAVALAAMGFSLGEALLPITAVALTGLIGWRGVWLAAAALLVALIPPLLWLLGQERTPRQLAETESAPGMAGRHWTRGEALGHWTFWALTPGLLAPPFIGTAVFFHGAHLSAVKGWSLTTVAAAFPFYSAATIAMSFVAAWAVDRFSARRLLPLYQAPLALGVALIGLWDAPAAAFVGFALLGATQGAAVAVIGALWPEVYGTRHIGAIRGVAVAMMVFSTALGPGATGALIDLGVGVEAQFAALSLWGAGTCLFYWAVAARIRAAMTPQPSFSSSSGTASNRSATSP